MVGKKNLERIIMFIPNFIILFRYIFQEIFFFLAIQNAATLKQKIKFLGSIHITKIHNSKSLTTFQGFTDVSKGNLWQHQCRASVKGKLYLKGRERQAGLDFVTTFSCKMCLNQEQRNKAYKETKNYKYSCGLDDKQRRWNELQRNERQGKNTEEWHHLIPIPTKSKTQKTYNSVKLRPTF